jgi:hypothetical protein
MLPTTSVVVTKPGSATSSVLLPPLVSGALNPGSASSAELVLSPGSGVQKIEACKIPLKLMAASGCFVLLGKPPPLHVVNPEV